MRKALCQKERAELELADVKDNVGSTIAAIAELGNLQVSAPSNPHSKLNATGRAAVHGKAWNAMSILRAAYTPVSSGAFATVAECGNSTPNDCRGLVARVIMSKTAEGLEALFGPPGEAPTPYAVFCKMHDSTKQLLTIPEERSLRCRQ